MNAVRIASLLLLQTGGLVWHDSNGEFWGTGLAISLCGLIPEAYRVATEIAQWGLAGGDSTSTMTYGQGPQPSRHALP